eukprot:TRINITY_DN59657_c0_g1_i1.p1 TRINITY_DN59657_c0_g1~~TRINITY_DN59657_c0_g1_i1.p1  ORF type:complete len:463 (+),score=62.53 TRINITY_DN59657_c0_g1_i1:112-1389(+)
MKECADCKRSVDLTSEYYDYVIPGILRRTDWQCGTCRTCQICKCTFEGSDPESPNEPYIPCDRCDRSFHYYCLDVERAPEGQFYCTVCTANDPFFGAKHRMVILMGPQCSGKSTLSKKLNRMFDWVIVNQDTFGTRNRCINVAHAALRKKHSVIIDRTNITKFHREKFLEVANSYAIPVDCVWLDIPFSVTVERLKQRKNHPNFNYCPETVGILSSIYRQCEPPTKAEGFREIYVFNSEAELNKVNLAALLGITRDDEKHQTAKKANVEQHQEAKKLWYQEYQKKNPSVSSADFEGEIDEFTIDVTCPSTDFMANVYNTPTEKGMLGVAEPSDLPQYDSDNDAYGADSGDDSAPSSPNTPKKEKRRPSKEAIEQPADDDKVATVEDAQDGEGKPKAEEAEKTDDGQKSSLGLNPKAAAWTPSWMK